MDLYKDKRLFRTSDNPFEQSYKDTVNFSTAGTNRPTLQR